MPATDRPPDTERALSVGLIGYGLGGAVFHAPFIATTPGLELRVIVTRNPERRAQAAREHPGATLVDSAEELWARARELDVVAITTPNRFHVPLARAALAAGLATVVDKPLAATAAEGRELIAEARRRDLPLTVFQNRRWDGDFLTVRRLLREGAVGRPLRFESRFDRWRPVPKGGWRERADPAEAGGLLYDLGSHLIDQALVLFGAVTHVYAELDRRRSGVEVDDDVFVALSHASGVRSHLSMSTVAAQPGARLRLLGDRAAYVKYGPDGQEDALRTGSRPGGPDWGKEPPERWGTLGAGEEVRAVPTERGAWASFYAELAAALRTGGSLPVDPNDSVSALEIIEAAQRSARDGVVVALGG